MTSENYIAKLGMKFNPFLKNAKEIIIRNREYEEALYRLEYLAKTKGFGLLTGSPGKGKTTIARNWAASLNPALFKVVYTSLSTLTVQEFYRNLLLELGVEPAYKKTDNFRLIQAEITRLALEKKKTPVIIIDEANSIKSAVLNDLKMIFNFEMDSRDRAVVLLTGLPQLNNLMRLSSNEPLRQRLVINYNVEGISKEEGREYILGKLSGAGCSSQVFDEGALEAILNAADGTPRMISKYCNSCFMIAAAKECFLITAETAMEAINECELD